MRISMVTNKQMVLRVKTAVPNEKATHVEVRVTHRDKRVRLDVDPVYVGHNMVRRSFSLVSKRRSQLPLMDMPRMAPKKFATICDLVASAVVNGDYSNAVWPMIREAAAEGGIEIMDPITLEDEKGGH